MSIHSPDLIRLPIIHGAFVNNASAAVDFLGRHAAKVGGADRTMDRPWEARSVDREIHALLYVKSQDTHLLKPTGVSESSGDTEARPV